MKGAYSSSDFAKKAMIWNHPPPTIDISTDELHIWHASLEQTTIGLRELEACLSGEESARADRFYSRKDRDAYVVSHGVLHCILSKYLGVDPSSVSFKHDHCGKPCVSPEINSMRLSFNMSHSGNFAVYGIKIDSLIGVDIEYMRPDVDIDSISEYAFTSAEREELGSLCTEERICGFYNCWTRKEALVKAIGRGISISLTDFDVTLSPGVLPRLLRVAGNIDSPENWRIFDINVKDSYAGAVAVIDPGNELKCFQWN